MDNNELYHYGVLGMKWGVRRNSSNTSSYSKSIGNRYHTKAARSVQRDADNLRKNGYKEEADAVQKVADKHRQKALESQKKYETRNKQNNTTHEDYKKAHSKKSIKSMSDAELRQRLNRIQMEQQYKNLNQSSINRGKKAVNKILKIGGTVATATGTAVAIYNNVDKIKKIINE